MTNPTGDPDNRPSRTVLLQIDASTHCQETMGAAAKIAAQLDAVLRGVFIEDPNLVSAARLEFVREFRLSSTHAHNLDNSTLKLQLATLASSARRHLEHAGAHRKVRVDFHTTYKNSAGQFEQDVDLTIVEVSERSHSHLARGDVPASLTRHSNTRPLLLLKSGVLLPEQFLVICDNVENARKCLEAVKLLQTDNQYVTLLPAAKNLHVALADIIHEQGLEANIDNTIDPNVSDILWRVGAIDNLLVVASDSPLLRESSNVQTLVKSRHPILLV